MVPILACAACGSSSHHGGADGPTGGDGSAGGDGAVPTGMLGAPSTATVQDAIAATMTTYHRNANTGDIWCFGCDGAPIALAVASFTGDTSADARLLQQMREIIKPGNNPYSTGGYAANDERNATGMYALAKLTPRVWSQLTADEVHKIDLVMEATLVADAYATADATNASGAPRTFDGSTDSDRDFNPNYREGMIGAVLVGTDYFGGAQATTALLASYDHAAFTAELAAQGLDQTNWTFATYQTTPAAGAPSPQTVQAGIQGYAMHGITLDHLLDMYVYLADDTFSATVACGLNGGAGILVGSVYAGKIVSGCAQLPNLGKVGMEKEFDSVDGNGARSDAGYVRLGLRADLFNQIVLMAYAGWADTTASTTALTQLQIGVTDFFYKAAQGYESYSHGTDEGLFDCTSMDCPLNQALWTEVLAPAHGM